MSVAFRGGPVPKPLDPTSIKYEKVNNWIQTSWLWPIPVLNAHHFGHMFKLFFEVIKTERNLSGCRWTFKEEVAFKNLTVS